MFTRFLPIDSRACTRWALESGEDRSDQRVNLLLYCVQLLQKSKQFILITLKQNVSPYTKLALPLLRRNGYAAAWSAQLGLVLPADLNADIPQSTPVTTS